MNKEEVITKIKNLCKEYGVNEPTEWTRENVQKVADRINNTCGFCFKYKGNGMDVICTCEVSNFVED